MAEMIQYKLPEHLAARREARRREWIVQWGSALLAVVCLVGAGLLLKPINTIRQEREFVIDPDSIGTLPPDIALLGKLGTFRALAIDWAAIRAERLKEQGKVYEALELHQTVCALAPRFPDVWVYAAWNMAYNISVMQYTPQARWQWVRNGLEILRDKGLVYNPKSVKLYKELSWIYWHKIGDFLDDEHLNYKRALAVEMETILGSPPVTLEEEEYFDWFRKIVDAPRDLPAVLRTNEEVRRIIAELEKVGLSPDATLLAFVARHIRPEIQVDELLKDQPIDDTPFQRQLRVLRDSANQPALELLLSTLRSDILREEYRFDLDWMFHLMAERYGPLDWRNAFSHSLYWASRGELAAEGTLRQSKTDEINNARFILFSLQNMATRGRMVLWPDFDDPFRSYIELTPEIRFIPYLFELYMELGKKHFGDHPEFKEGTPGPNFHTGFVTNMHNWIELLYLEGGQKDLDRAENLYAWLRQNNPHPDGRTQEQYLVSIDQFVLGDLRSQMDTYRAASAIVGSFIRQALKQYALGQSEAGSRSMTHANDCYRYWMRDMEHDRRERRLMQSPRIQLRDQIESFMNEPRYAALAKARLWRGLPLEYRQAVYDRLRPVLERICAEQNPPWSHARAFPEPAGMDEYRKRPPDPDRPSDTETEEGTRFRGR